MLTSAHRNRRSRQRARQTCRKPRSPRRRGPTIHQQAISRLSLELRATEGLHCWFHSGVSWRAYQHLIERGSRVIVEAERELRVAGRRFIPDLTLRCPKSGEIRLLIEVWHTHAVSVAKRRAFATQGLPWIEVRAWHVVNRFRRQPLPVLDWGGINIDPPTQTDLFEIPPVQQGTGCTIDNFMTNWQARAGSHLVLQRWAPLPHRLPHARSLY